MYEKERETERERKDNINFSFRLSIKNIKLKKSSRIWIIYLLKEYLRLHMYVVINFYLYKIYT